MGIDSVDSGAVLGIDVGFSQRRKTTCFCLLEWDRQRVRISLAASGSAQRERRQVLRSLVPRETRIGCVALDGPLTRGLRIVRHYRSAEAILSRGVFQKRGKPGQTSAPAGQQLHAHATALARLVVAEHQATHLVLAPSRHLEPVFELALVEAFPNQFLAALIPESALPELKRDASDRFWEVVCELGQLERLTLGLLPGLHIDFSFQEIADHDERAGVICALTALSVARGHYVGVGDAEDGEIVVPARDPWGNDAGTGESWFAEALGASLPAVRAARGSHPNHRHARVVSDGELWSA